MRKQSLELHFEARPGGVRLAWTCFHRSACRGESAAGPFTASDLTRAAPGPGRTFQQTRGVRAFALALVRLRARRGTRAAAEATPSRPLLEGGRGSAAASLDAVLLRPDDSGWLRAMLDPRPDLGGSGLLKARLDGWFQRRNSNRNDRSQPVRVFARAPGHAAALSPEEVVVFVDGAPADAAALAAVETALAAGFTGGVDAAGGVVRFSGTPLPAAEPFVGRAEERAWLGAAMRMMSGGNRRVVQVVAPGGMGKTGLVAAWLREAMAAGPAGGFAFERVFRWDFRGEASTPAPSKTWREALASALGFRRSPDGNSWSETGMVSALCAQRTLLLLESLEVTLFPRGDPRAGEFRDDVIPRTFDTLFAGAGAGRNDPGCLVTTRQAVRAWPAGTEAATLRLSGLADGESRALLRRLGVEAPQEKTAAAVRFAGGRPLWLRGLAGAGRTG